jgi:hypothetical protein
MSTVAQRRSTHAAINSLSHYTVAKIVRSQYPNVPLRELNVLAKRVIATAHEIVSPKGKR